MTRFSSKLKYAGLVTGLSMTCTQLNAANYGTDLNLTMMPASGGMGGVGIARPQDTGSAVFGNPASLTQFNGTHFMFGATFYAQDVDALHDGTTTGTAWSGDSDAGPYLIPSIAITQSLNNRVTLGLGLGVVAGIGSDFRKVPGSLGPLAEIMVFGANAGAAYQVNDNLSLGAVATMGMGFGQAGLNSNTSSTSNFGLRATLGANYSMDYNTLGLYYRSPLSIEYDNMVQYSTTGFHSPTFEQPQEVGFGIANGSLAGGKLLIAADVVWKDWESADSYRDLYDNQTVFALGAQYTTGPYKLRVGFSHADSPIKKNVGSNVGSITSLLVGGATVPLNPALTRYVQATNGEVVWEDQVTLGVGWNMSKMLTLDAHASVALDRAETIGETRVDAGAWQVGGAFTWHFD
ncbi:outer membrane protein transport protein [Sedimenticola selenatireducens]|uniref:OmpP1/FadL family transporter n=1 Tax=Sedimenticola selenatireducens TaxID=191960 RepID=UPI002AAAE486|nr:outer membrane protein transport protein [Sedimenticola selenatireducens]